MQKPRILTLAFDNQIYKRQSVGGISRYFSELRSGLLSSPCVEITNNLDAEILHATFYSGKPRKSRHQKLVSTLYDMIPERLPGFFPFSALRDRFGIGAHANKLEWLRASDLIISISHASAEELDFFLPATAPPIKVIHLCSSMITHPVEPVYSMKHQRYWLYVGKRSGYKNWIVLVMALAKVSHGQDMPILLAVGGGSFSSIEQRWIADHNLQNKIRHEVVSESQLAWLYRHAEAVLVPSIAEGFSLPLIEALHTDTPVIASDIQAHREVGGEYATLISPCCTNAWTDIINSVIVKALPRPSVVLGSDKWCKLVDYYGQDRLAKDHLEAYWSILA